MCWEAEESRLRFPDLPAVLANRADAPRSARAWPLANVVPAAQTARVGVWPPRAHIAGCSALVAVQVPCHASLEAWVSQIGRFAGVRSTYCTLTRRIACLKKILMRCDRDCSAASGRASSEHWILPWSKPGTVDLALGSMREPAQRTERDRHRHRAPTARSHRGT